MIDTKLIVLDGLPGHGKTTTGQWLNRQIQQNSLKTHWLQEADVPHPLWWYNHWDGTQYLPPNFSQTPVETFIETSLQKWTAFVATADKTDKVTIAESVFFQNAVAMFLMGGAQPSDLMAYAHLVQQIVHRLNPVLIYFYQPNVAAALQKICRSRGPAYQNTLIKNMESFPYLQQRSLNGLAGVSTLWQDIRALTDSLFDAYAIRKLAIDNSNEDWLRYQQQILRFLALPLLVD